MNLDKATEETTFHSVNGYLALAVAIAALFAAVAIVIRLASANGGYGGEVPVWPLVSLPLLILLFAFLVKGVYMLQPNQAALLLLFGAYRGSDFATGLRWANPFLSKKKVSLRLRNFNSDKLKVNDRSGNPIEIGAAVVWRVGDTARALLDIDDFEAYVPVQAEAAIRHLASEYAYDSGEQQRDELNLRGGGDAIVARLKAELKARFEKAGLEVEDARLTHLAYAPEIAGAMLRRQQAEAVVAARKQIVLGAVSMVEMALEGLKERNIIELDPERRASMVSNLLVVLCGETEAQPVINAGTLYQ